MEVPFMDLNRIYDSGHVFRWIKLRDDKYVIQNGDKALKVEQNRDRFDIQKCRLIMSCTEEEFYETWFHYFDMTTDYGHPFFAMNRSQEEIFKVWAVRAGGCRVIQPDLFESIISFIIAAHYKTHAEACVAIEKLTQVCGIKKVQSMRENGKVVWYTFPSAESILSHRSDLSFMDKSLVKRLCLTCEDIVSGWIDLPLLQQMSFMDSLEYLMMFDYIPIVSAENICLHGLHHTNCFPGEEQVDELILKELDMDGETFVDWHLGDVEGYEGIIFQYVLFNKLNSPQD